MIDPPPCLRHVPRGVAGPGHHRLDVDRHDLVKIRQVVVEESAMHGAGHACVVDHDVQAAEVLDRRRHQAADLIDVRNIGLHEQSVFANFGGQRLTAVTVDVADQHLRAFGREPSHQPFDQSRKRRR